MPGKWEFRRYEEFTVRAARDFAIPLVHSIEQANLGWGLRRLSPSGLETLEAQSQTDSEAAVRWRNRLRVGYEREKAQVATEVEEIFSDMPCASQHDNEGREDAA